MDDIKILNLKTQVISLEALTSLEEGSKEWQSCLETLILPAAKALQNNETVAFPTETVYGIGANALSDEAVAKIFEAKGRPSDNPLIVHIAKQEDLNHLVKEVSDVAKKLMDAFWPGAITLIMPKNDSVPNAVTAGLSTVAIRMPSHPVAKGLIELSGCPVAAPSANISGRPSPTCGRDVVADLEGRVSVILYGEDAQIGLESTVVDVTGEEPVVLRPGGITLEMIIEAVGSGKYDEKLNMKLATGEKPKSPGMKYTHYSPKAEVYVFTGDLEKVETAIKERIKDAHARGVRPGVMTVSELGEDFEGAIVLKVGSFKTPETAATNLFKTLREFDLLGAEEVYAVGFELEGIGMAIMNRLIKAAGHRVTKL